MTELATPLFRYPVDSAKTMRQIAWKAEQKVISAARVLFDAAIEKISQEGMPIASFPLAGIIEFQAKELTTTDNPDPLATAAVSFLKKGEIPKALRRQIQDGEIVQSGNILSLNPKTDTCLK